MRQIGMASAMYASDYGSEYAHRLLPLVQTGHLPVSIVRSPADPTKTGLANSILNCNRVFGSHQVRPTPVYDSYLSVDDSDITSNMQFTGASGEGWLVALSRSTPAAAEQPIADCKYSLLEGGFQRLLIDGSVVHRRHRWTTISKPVNTRAQKPMWLFSDAN
jgi:hypothetical protein